jgi:hypothetical protein
MELHDRLMVGVRTDRLELDETWSFVGKKQKNTKPHETQKGGQYVFDGMAARQKAIVSYQDRQARHLEHGAVHWRSARARDRTARDFDGRLPSLPPCDSRRLRFGRLSWRDRKDLQRNQPRPGRSHALLPGCRSSRKP